MIYLYSFGKAKSKGLRRMNNRTNQATFSCCRQFDLDKDLVNSQSVKKTRVFPNLLRIVVFVMD